MNEPVDIVSDYIPSEAGKVFHSSPAKFKILVGGYGSGKSRMIIEEIKALSIEYPGLVSFIMRKTMPALRDSTLHEYRKYMPDELGNYNHKTETFTLVNRSLTRFRGLDEATKLKSTNPAVIVLEEADEFSYEDFMVLKARARQEGFPNHVILGLNPVDEDHWIFKQFVDNAKSYEEEGLLVQNISTYENESHLPPGYIKQVTAGMTPDEVERYIFGKWGTIIKGAPVYAKILNPDLHLSKWQFNGNMLLLRGWDFGFNHPAAVIRLKDPAGRKNIDFAILGDKEDLEPFGRRVLAACEARYGKILKVFDYCDPRGFDKSDKGQSSVDVLNSIGVFPIGERGVRAYVEPGIQIIRKEFSTLIEGKPELTINPDCGIIRSAYFGRYVRDENGDVKKDGYYEHVCDADRYIAYNDRSNNAVRDAITARLEKRSTRTLNPYTGYGR